MATTLHYDADAAAQLVAINLTPDMVAQRAAVLRALVPNAGDRVLDVGSGPGLLAAAIAERVGAAGQVLGVDIGAPPTSSASTATCSSRRACAAPRGPPSRAALRSREPIAF